jgi:diguanylate cyclase (GGDEF)-like protein
MTKGMEFINPNLDLNTPLKSGDNIPVLKATDKIYKMIYEDPLTGFENRRGLQYYRNNLKPDEYPVLMLIFDLDNLKKINDNEGHPAGDKYICSFVEFVNEFFPNDKKFRLGGDEFLIPIKNIKSNLDLDQKISETILSKLEVFNQKQRQHKLEFTYAIDVASSHEDFYESLKRSDIKEVTAKKIKKNQQLQTLSSRKQFQFSQI